MSGSVAVEMLSRQARRPPTGLYDPIAMGAPAHQRIDDDIAALDKVRRSGGAPGGDRPTAGSEKSTGRYRWPLKPSKIKNVEILI